MFSGCSSLASIIISISNPSRNIWVGDRALRGCSRLKSIYLSVNSAKEFCQSSVKVIKGYGYENNINHLPIKLMIAGEIITNLVIPCTLRTINENCFNNITGLTSITLSANNVEECCQSSVNQLLYSYNVNLPRTLMIAGEKVTKLVIPNTVKSIYKEAFKGCAMLNSVTIPNSVQSIGEDAFKNTGIYNNKSNWVENVLYIDNCLIKSLNSSEKYAIIDGTRLIADAAFNSCTQLKSVKFPKSSLTTIGANAFNRCSFNSIKLPKSVTHIGNDAFSKYTKVK
jgi:hypothetical protein